MIQRSTFGAPDAFFTSSSNAKRSMWIKGLTKIKNSLEETPAILSRQFNPSKTRKILLRPRIRWSAFCQESADRTMRTKASSPTMAPSSTFLISKISSSHKSMFHLTRSLGRLTIKFAVYCPVYYNLTLASANQRKSFYNLKYLTK